MSDLSLFGDDVPDQPKAAEATRIVYPPETPCRNCPHMFRHHWGNGPCIHAYKDLDATVCPCSQFEPKAR